MKIHVKQGEGQPGNPFNMYEGNLNPKWKEFNDANPKLPCFLANGEVAEDGEYTGEIKNQWRTDVADSKWIPCFDPISQYKNEGYDTRTVYVVTPKEDTQPKKRRAIPLTYDEWLSNKPAFEDIDDPIYGPGNNNYGRDKSILDKSETAEEAAIKYQKKLKFEFEPSQHFEEGAAYQKAKTIDHVMWVLDTLLRNEQTFTELLEQINKLK